MDTASMSGSKRHTVSFTVDGQQHQVTLDGGASPSASAVTATTSLADYLRNQCGLTGTKVMCRGGMCGACVVAVRVPNTHTDLQAVNSCLAPLHNCQGWDVITVQNIGDRKQGYHPAQSRLAQLNGTQCGYCSPGMVMSMYSLLESGSGVTQQTVEQHLDGNLCRCTGYRPILDAFETFVPKPSIRTKQIIKDIEDISPSAKSSGACKGSCSSGGRCSGCPRAMAVIWTTGAQWEYPTSLAQLCAIIKACPAGTKLKLVRGNTGTGLYKDVETFDTYVSLLQVPELTTITKAGTSITLGATVSLSELIQELQIITKTTGFRHCADMASHLLRVANTPVRNAGSWAGNLVMKKNHLKFPSDVFLLLAAAQGQLTIADENGATSKVSVEGLLAVDMSKKVIVSVTLPSLDESKYVYKSYKITPRAISSEAYVNAAFLLPVDMTSLKVTEKPTLLYGGINADFLHAAATEAFLTGKVLSDEATLQGALSALQAEVTPDADPALASPKYRKGLAASLLYKVVLSVLGDKVPAPLQSGGEDLTRPVSSGTQQFDTDKTLWPVNEAVPKVEAQAQTSGEAKFAGDEAPEPGELHAAFVLSTIASGTMSILDPAPALAVPGVVAFIGAAEVPGVNNTCSDGVHQEELFSSSKINYYGQAVGLILADTDEIARKAAPLVHIEYKDTQPPVLTIKDALKARNGGTHGEAWAMVGDADKKAADGTIKRKKKQDLGCYGTPSDPTDLHQVSGELNIGGQYHFTLETQTVRAVPREDDQLDLFSATQDMRDVCVVASQLTTLPSHKINMLVRRLGGGYGSKLQHPSRVAGAAAVAAVYLNRPVRLVLDIQTNMAMLGGRLPYQIQYQAGVDDSGKIETLQVKLTEDRGYSNFVTTTDAALTTIGNVYQSDNWDITTDNVLTNTPSNTYCRSPGTVQGVTSIEHVLDHIAHELSMDPWKVRQANFFVADTKFGTGNNPPTDHDVFMKLVNEMFSEADIDQRKTDITQFNQGNRWRKRALSLVPCRWPVVLAARYPAVVSIFGDDGTVAVSTGGVEMGQGLNTKVAQVCAKVLGVSMSLVSIKPNMNVINPNGSATGGSLGSDMCSMAAKAACEEMNERLKPYKADGKAWRDVIKDANAANINLTVHSYQQPVATPYNVFALAAAELELDVLTGEYRVNRVDLYEDAGQSLSPWVDVGQLEGAFIMGMGLHLFEQYRYDPTTGQKLTDSAASYFVPSSKDIPTDFRVKLLDNNYNPVGIFNSKATGEPPLCTTYSCLSALRMAVAEARKDAGKTDWTQLDAPGTVEHAQMACQLSTDMFVLS